MKYNVYTDGSSCGNPGLGGFAVVIMNEDNTVMQKEGLHGRFEDVTNNYMELYAIKGALMIAAENPDDTFVIHSDSAYCVNMCNDWIWKWKMNNWTRSKGQPIENLEIIKDIYDLLDKDFPNFIIKKVPGHSGIVGNEIADAIASNNLIKLRKIFLKNHIKHETFGFLEIIEKL